mmetsp:Transcript_4676/g.11355  ORF Transcript_4676/g.11355 Transcript_4676/m.11355 type:complete len:206 (-) Transcript_4676:308-925(-)
MIRRARWIMDQVLSSVSVRTRTRRPLEAWSSATTTRASHSVVAVVVAVSVHTRHAHPAPRKTATTDPPTQTRALCRETETRRGCCALAAETIAVGCDAKRKRRQPRCWNVSRRDDRAIGFVLESEEHRCVAVCWKNRVVCLLCIDIDNDDIDIDNDDDDDGNDDDIDNDDDVSLDDHGLMRSMVSAVRFDDEVQRSAFSVQGSIG